MIKVLSVFGTRPEAIKMAPVIKELEKYPEQVTSRVCVTAQHRQMLDQVLHFFDIVPDHDFNLMRENQSPPQVAAAVLAGLEPVLAAERPDWVLVQGDTATAMAASLGSFYAGVRVGHVEAGLRTFDKTQPFPEEIHRRVTGVVADLHFAPTARARDNLLREKIAAETIHVTGNPVIDALQAAAAAPHQPATGLPEAIPWHRRIIFATSHRRENFGRPLAAICRALAAIATSHEPDVHIVFSVHLNPRVRDDVHGKLNGIPGITLLPPLDYLTTVQLLKRSYLVLTDSGGLQEEAPSLGKPVLVLRNTTERPEGIAAGTAMLVGTSCRRIVSETRRLLNDAAAYRQMAQAVNPYGDGRAAGRIVAALLGRP